MIAMKKTHKKGPARVVCTGEDEGGCACEKFTIERFPNGEIQIVCVDCTEAYALTAAVAACNREG